MEFNESLALQLLESEIEFPVNFDDAWQWLEYSEKSKAKRALLNCGFTENVDYNIDISGELRPQGGFSNREIIFLTVDCFKQLCMMSGTEKGKEVRLYFLKCEKVLKERIKAEQSLTQSQLAIQLTNFIQQQQEMNVKLLERTVKLDKIEQASRLHPGLADVLEGEVNNSYPDDLHYTVEEYLNAKGVHLSHLNTMRKRVAQFLLCGSFGLPTKNSKNQNVYRGQQINYLDSALRTILDI